MDKIIMVVSALIALVAIVVGYKFFAWIVTLRIVVPTNEVHIVQRGKNVISFGTGQTAGNVYYDWPSWMPIIGITKTMLPVSNFNISLNSYDAYDKGRVPFEVDVMAFFRISNPYVAAQRVSNFSELTSQLTTITQGAVRNILAQHEIDSIMGERAIYGEQFTAAVTDQLSQWGVEAVKSIELMDIRDSKDNKVIHNIMEKKKSLIESESRIEVANNHRNAQVAEVEADRLTDIKKTEAEENVQMRITEKNRNVAVAQETAKQEVHTQAAITKEKEMAVVRVNDVQRQTITKDMEVVQAEGDKQKRILAADAMLETQKRDAEGIKTVGLAKAEAEKAIQLAPVQAQITLAKEIGDNAGYQTYLLSIRTIEKDQAVGIKQAEALAAAELKVIANSGDVTTGLNSFADLFTSKGGAGLGSALEALANTDAGKKLVDKITMPKV